MEQADKIQYWLTVAPQSVGRYERLMPPLGSTVSDDTLSAWAFGDNFCQEPSSGCVFFGLCCYRADAIDR